jgi:hypothetical protein
MASARPGWAKTRLLGWHGLLHYVFGGVGFLWLIAACFVLASRFAFARQCGWAAYSCATGVIFPAAFAGNAEGSGPIVKCP